MLEFITANWAELLLAILGTLKVIVNLTPGVQDNRVFTFIDAIVDAVITTHTTDNSEE